MAEPGCVVCGKPRSPKDGVADRCGHHRRQLLRNQRKPQPTAPSAEDPKPPALEDLTPSAIRKQHESGSHKGRVVTACLLCIRERGGKVNGVEAIRVWPKPK